MIINAMSKASVFNTQSKVVFNQFGRNHVRTCSSLVVYYKSSPIFVLPLRDTTHVALISEQLQAFWYFFGGILVFGFYITNLFVGVMFEAFLSFKNMDSMGNLISQAERRWRDYEKRLSQV